MLKALGSRLTYANVMATVAAFLALGGGAYALTGIPDRGGVYHGCVDPRTGVLRVVKAASACRKPKTVRRGNRRVRIPGESAIAWNQQGRQGIQGLQGPPGSPAQPGQAGSPGLSGYETVSASTAMDSNSPKPLSVACPPGKVPIGGGSRLEGTVGSAALDRDSPISGGWDADAYEPVATSNTWELQTTVICAFVTR